MNRCSIVQKTECLFSISLDVTLKGTFWKKSENTKYNKKFFTAFLCVFVCTKDLHHLCTTWTCIEKGTVVYGILKKKYCEKYTAEKVQLLNTRERKKQFPAFCAFWKYLEIERHNKIKLCKKRIKIPGVLQRRQNNLI